MLAEITHAHLAAFVSAHSKSDPHIEPLRIPRPWDEEQDDGAVSPADFAAMFGGKETA